MGVAAPFFELGWENISLLVLKILKFILGYLKRLRIQQKSVWVPCPYLEESLVCHTKKSPHPLHERFISNLAFYYLQFLRLPSNYLHLFNSKPILTYIFDDKENELKPSEKVNFICNSFSINYKISSNDGPKPAQGKFYPSCSSIAQSSITIAYFFQSLHS